MIYALWRHANRPLDPKQAAGHWPDSVGRRSGRSCGSGCDAASSIGARTLSGCVVMGRIRLPPGWGRAVSGLHEVSRGSAPLGCWVGSSLRRRAENASIVLGMRRSDATDLDNSDPQGQPLIRGHVSTRTSRPRLQLGHGTGSGLVEFFASEVCGIFDATEGDDAALVDTPSRVRQRAS